MVMGESSDDGRTATVDGPGVEGEVAGLPGTPIGDLDPELIRAGPQGEPDHGLAVDDRVDEQLVGHQDDVVDEVVRLPGDEGLAHHGTSLTDDRQIPADGLETSTSEDVERRASYATMYSTSPKSATTRSRPPRAST
ncbi:hypothetical protein GCM10022252_04450 [Streptosporangium oxazolinicum]|uniref:Uncharacterized protein n=1 Tax=Streptosporangium oxazolinicum TaxID=909287 RepID=A0ABP8AB22_9ACTN